MNYERVLNEIYDEIQPYFKKALPNPLPTLYKIKENDFAMSMITIKGEEYNIGCTKKTFPILGLSKLFNYTLALNFYGQDIYSRVGYEHAGNPINALAQLEFEQGVPRNPLTDAGGLLTTDLLLSSYKDESFDQVQEFIQGLSEQHFIESNSEIYNYLDAQVEDQLNLLRVIKKYKNLKNPMEKVVNTYNKINALMMNTEQLAHASLYLASHGRHPLLSQSITSEANARRINALLLTNGHYDATGFFTYRVGLPGKSSRSGAIIAIIPKKMALCVYSPLLNKHHTSMVATKALELFAAKTRHAIF